MEATYTETRTNFASYWDRVVDEREPLTIHRRGAEDVVLLPADELQSLQETAQGDVTSVQSLKKELDCELK